MKSEKLSTESIMIIVLGWCNTDYIHNIRFSDFFVGFYVI